MPDCGPPSHLLDCARSRAIDDRAHPVIARAAPTRCRSVARVDEMPTNAATTGTVLFLDFDGVLHPDPCRDRRRLFEHAPRLAAALAPFADLTVVLSTSWRNEIQLADLAQHLPRSLRERLVGVTESFHAIDCAPALVPYRRQAECQNWIDTERPGAHWLALDDRASGFQPYFEQLILTRSDTGLDESSVNRLCFALMQAARSGFQG